MARGSRGEPWWAEGGEEGNFSHAVLRHWRTALPREYLQSSGQAPKWIKQLCVFLRFSDFWSPAPGIKKTLP